MSGRTPFAEIADRANQGPEQRARIETLKRAMYDALALGRLLDQLDEVEPAANGSETVLDLARVDSATATRDDELYLAALRGYVADLGGHLVLEAVFPGIRVNLLRSSEASRSSTAVAPIDDVAARARTAS